MKAPTLILLTLTLTTLTLASATLTTRPSAASLRPATRVFPCRTVTEQRVIACLCEIARRQLLSRRPRGPARQVVRGCVAALGVSRKRFMKRCEPLGFDISGKPRKAVRRLNRILERCA